jgi:histidinol-phosphatase (PHP family)
MSPKSAINNSIPMDMHVHSTCSGDAVSSIIEYIHRAVALGLAEIGFCEHVDFDPRDEGYGTFDPARYDLEIEAARSATPGIGLRQGIEVAYQSSREDEIRTWLAARPWDYIVASIHVLDYADGWAIISEPGTVDDYFAFHTQRQSYVPYFEELLRVACSGLGDVLGHFDLVKRYGVRCHGPFEPSVFEEEIRAVLRAAVESGMGLEINTSGLRQSPGEPYPALTVLRWYRELGGEILTVGSDAHHADDLGAGIPEALDMARAAGFRAIATFEQRQVHWLDL